MHRSRPILASLAGLALAAGVLLGAAPAAVAAPVAHTAAVAPVIMNSIVLGTVDDPHVYISGEGFGDAPPPSYWAGSTRCGFSGWSNGGWYADALTIRVVGRFAAGRGTLPANGTCIGLFVDHWSHNYVVVHLGSAYGDRAGQLIRHGDTYVVGVLGATGRGRIDLI